MNDIIVASTPTNIVTEQEKFLASDTYNPQFTYKENFDPDSLYLWGKPQPRYAQFALKMLAQHPQHTVDTSELVTENFIRQEIENFNQKHRLEKPLQVVFSPNLVSRCKVSGSTIYFQLPIKYRFSKFEDLMRHELETHILRKINHGRQPWADFDVAEAAIRRTEEGLANLHTHLWRTNKLLTRSYFTYLAVSLAQQGSFRQVFQAIRKYGVTEHTAWLLALRTKRGLTDTSLPGGLTKDVTYFEGTVQVWDWLINQKNDPRDLYLGRLSLDLIPKYKAQAIPELVTYPSFFDNLNEYVDNINQIGEVNHFAELL